jgi:hypothetical protein
MSRHFNLGSNLYFMNAQNTSMRGFFSGTSPTASPVSRFTRNRRLTAALPTRKCGATELEVALASFRRAESHRRKFTETLTLLALSKLPESAEVKNGLGFGICIRHCRPSPHENYFFFLPAAAATTFAAAFFLSVRRFHF